MSNSDSKIFRLASKAAKTIPGLKRMVMLTLSIFWRTYGSWQFRANYKRALTNGEKIQIHVGAGSVMHNGWFNTDINLLQLSELYYLNVAKPFPIKDNTVRHIFNEHFIEHISFNDAEYFLRECFRVLISGGVIRIATPDLEAYCREYLGNTDNARLLIERNRNLGYEYGPDLASMMNKIFYADNHKYVYDLETLGKMLEKAGFSNVKRYKVRESDIPELCNLEEHDVGSIHDNHFTLVVEAKKIVSRNNKE